MSRQKDIYSQLISQFDLLIDEPMKNHTSFKVGGPADLFAQPKTLDQLKDLLKTARKADIPVMLFGSGTNLLITDKGIRGLVITTRQLKSGIQMLQTDNNQFLIQADAGEQLSKVCRFAMDHSLSGLEFAVGIPGTLGGAVFMNAGTPDGNMAGIIECVNIINPDTLNIETLQHTDLCFSYRQSSLSGILFAATLRLVHSDPDQIRIKMDLNLKKKTSSQPLGVASAGCFFKNPGQGKPAGQLIEEAGLKGMRINDAQISQIHANYIVNLDQATCQDILQLKQMVQETIMKQYHIKLETEVRIEGE
ncbi:MAG: UDP-N-acetylmuramate dehydrogenase [Pseudomonadota bacterium]